MRLITLFFAAACLASPARSAPAEDLARGAADQLCAWIVAEARDFDFERGEAALESRLSRELTEHENVGNRNESFRRIILDYAERRMSRGRTGLHAFSEALGIFRSCLHPGLTPERLRAAFLLAEKEAEYVERLPPGPRRAYTPGDLGIEAGSGPTARLVHAFAGTGTPIFVLDLEGASNLLGQIVALSMVPLIPDGALWLPEGVAQAMHQTLFQTLALTRAGRATSHVERPFVWKAQHLHSLSARADVVHEMRHAVHYERWDLRRVLEHFVGKVMPQVHALRDPIARDREVHGPLADQYRQSVSRFVNTAARKYRESVAREASGLGPLEWLVFRQYLRFLEELSAHAAEGAWYEEAGLEVPHSLRGEGRFDWVLRTYMQSGHVDTLVGYVFQLFRNEIETLVVALNEPANARRE